ncbi:hypothetical protein AVEN_58396-1 [Araneus ventricosus]|uniref:Uncharacterized protein n=1 Tax=Araneus ventricosus TaxID=182803 RepID=A0A4Y2F2F1_ARAVE|nr:hypothetical protein AVEN_58396-1 [Araneus ventricosus]
MLPANFFKQSRQRRLTRFDVLDDLLSLICLRRQSAPVRPETKENRKPTHGKCECENESKHGATSKWRPLKPTTLGWRGKEKKTAGGCADENVLFSDSSY